MDNELTFTEVRRLLQNEDYESLKELFPSLEMDEIKYYCDEYQNNYKEIIELRCCGQSTERKDKKEKLLIEKLLIIANAKENAEKTK